MGDLGVLQASLDQVYQIVDPKSQISGSHTAEAKADFSNRKAKQNKTPGLLLGTISCYGNTQNRGWKGGW